MKLKGDLQTDFGALFKELKMPMGFDNAPCLQIDLSKLDINFGKLRKELGLPEPQGGRSGWNETFSDPREYQAQSFRFLVHGFQDSYSRMIQHSSLTDPLLGGGFDPTQFIDLSTNPNRISEKKLISASIVDQDHRSTFGSAGLILSCPLENVIDISPIDMGTNYTDPDSVLKNRERSLPSLERILEDTNPFAWNETRLTGKTEAGEVKVVGYWIKADERGAPQNPEVAEQVRQLANINALPLIVFIIESEPMMDQPPEVYSSIGDDSKPRSRAVSINKDGLRYFVDLNKKEATVVDRYRKVRPMTAAEMVAFKKDVAERLDPEKYREIGERLEMVVAGLG